MASLSFTLSASTSPSTVSIARRGSLTLRRVTSSPSLPCIIETPAPLIFSRRLLFPHLTMDTLDSIDDLHANEALVNLNMEQCCTTMPVTYPGSIHKFANMGERYLIWTSRDNALPPCDVQRGDDHGTMRTDGGIRKVSVEQYMDLVNQWKPDAFVTLADTIHGDAVSARIAQRCTDRTLKLMDACLQANECNITAIGTITGCNEAEITRCATSVNSRNGLSGFLIDVLSSEKAHIDRLVKAAANALPKNLLRIGYNLLTPDQVVLAIGHIDVFPITYAYMLAQTGHALNLSLSEPLTVNEILNLNSNENKASRERLHHPLKSCNCWACRHHNRAYVYHLLDAHEMLGWTLLTIHNMHQYTQFLKSIRDAIDVERTNQSDPPLSERLQCFLDYYNAQVKTIQDQVMSNFYAEPNDRGDRNIGDDEQQSNGQANPQKRRRERKPRLNP